MLVLIIASGCSAARGTGLPVSSAIVIYKYLTIHCACVKNKCANNKIMDKKYVIQCAVRGFSAARGTGFL